MFDRTSELIVPCSPAEAFDHIAVHFFENHPRWDPDIVELVRTSPGPIGAGATGRETRQAGGRRFVTEFRINEFEPPRRFAHRSTAGSMGEDVDYEIAPGEGGRALIRVHLRIYPKTLAMRLLFPLIRRVIQRNYAVNSARFERILNEIPSGVTTG